MQTAPGPTTTHRQTMAQAAGSHSGSERAPLTPAERIALTVALLNHGLDLMNGFARTSLAGCVRGSSRGQHDPQPERQSVRAD